MAAPNGQKTLRVQDQVFDLDSFSEVTLIKDVPFTPVQTVDEALNLLSNDSEKLLRVINRGMESEIRKEARAIPEGFQVLEDGEVKGPFTGTPADMPAVNSLILTLAKTVFGFNKDQTLEQKQAAKEAARSMIRATPAIKEGLKKTAALGTTPAE